MVPRENKDNAYAKFGRTNKEYYGISQSESDFHADSNKRHEVSPLLLFPLSRTFPSSHDEDFVTFFVLEVMYRNFHWK